MIDTIEHNGRLYRVTIERDDYHQTPWDNEDGHGDVTEWERRAKMPGELVLCGDERGGLGTDSARRFYDYAGAVRRARSEGWGFMPYPIQTGNNGAGTFWASVHGAAFTYRAESGDINKAVAKVYAAWRTTFPTDRAYRAAAARADFERLRAWCNDEWSYVGVVVEAECPCCGSPAGESVSLWGIESDAGAYLDEVARELADQIETHKHKDCEEC